MYALPKCRVSADDRTNIGSRQVAQYWPVEENSSFQQGHQRNICRSICFISLVRLCWA